MLNSGLLELVEYNLSLIQEQIGAMLRFNVVMSDQHIDL